MYNNNSYRPRRIRIKVYDDDTHINFWIPLVLIRPIIGLSQFILSLDNRQMEEQKKMGLELAIEILKNIREIRIQEPLDLVDISGEDSIVKIQLS